MASCSESHTPHLLSRGVLSLLLKTLTLGDRATIVGYIKLYSVSFRLADILMNQVFLHCDVFQLSKGEIADK